MDGQTLASLLQQSQIPDTTKLKAITAELQKKYKEPGSLLELIEIVCTDGNVAVRQQAAVQAARLVPKHWKAATAEHKAAVRKHLMDATLKEENAKCRHSDAHLVAAIATYDFDDGEWPDLLPVLFDLAEKGNVAQQEIGSYIIYSTLEANPEIYKEHIAKLLNLFAQLIQHSSSADVQINTVMSIGAMLALIEMDEDANEAAIEAIRNLVPQMGLVLKRAVDAGDDGKVQQVFDVLQQFLAFNPAFIGNHLRSLVQFMITLAADKDNDDDVRVQAMSFLTQTVHYRRLKIQAMRDMASVLVVQSMQILTEISDDDSLDEETPGHLALSLLDALASGLPPRQVLVPLLDEFPKYASSPDPALRKAGILALGNCAEGAPDFVNTQLKTVLPTVIGLLNDPDGNVRHAALIGLTGLAEEMPDDIATEHAAIMSAILKNLEAAMAASSDAESAKKNGQVICAACSAFDSLSNGLKSETMKQYAHQIIEPIGRLFAHPDTRVKMAATNALGAIAESLEQEFVPYFEKSMQGLGSYATIKGEELELQLRSATFDSVGRIAVAVGPKIFQPFVMDLMQASEENLKLDDDRLKESSFIFWAYLAKVYGPEFQPFLPGVFKALFDALDGDGDELAIRLTDEEKAIIAAGGSLNGKTIKIHDIGGDDEDSMDDDDDDDDDDDWAGIDSEAEEKEVAVEVLGDLITHACGEEEIKEYLEKAVSVATDLMEHHHGGIRKAAVGMLWRSYARVWQLMEKSTGTKWEPGFPPKETPTPILVKLAETVIKPTLELWVDEVERDVVAEVNRNVAATLETCGPAIVAQEGAIQEIVSTLCQIITKSHPCQQDADDEEDAQTAEESSEYDWVVVETALDVIKALSTAIGPAFGELWKIFEKPITKIASANESYERSSAIGTIGGCIGCMGAAVSPYTGSLLKIIARRLRDEDAETKSNAAFAVGQLVESSTNSGAYLPSYPSILESLEQMLAMDDTGHRVYDNAAAAVCRMITAHPDRVQIADYLPAVVARLPLKEDYVENKPIFTCIFSLYEHNEPTVQQLTPQLIPVFEQVLSPPDEQLESETRVLIQRAVQILSSAKPELFQGHAELLKLAGAN